MNIVKNQNGVTLSALIVYIIMMMIIVGTVATITSMFYRNINNFADNSENIAKINKFNMYFLEEVKQEENTIVSINKEGNQVTFSSGNSFRFQNKTLYFNSIKICENVQDAKFSVSEQNAHKIIEVYITIGNNMEYSKTTQYVLN